MGRFFFASAAGFRHSENMSNLPAKPLTPMTVRIIFILACSLYSPLLIAQGVKIGGNASEPHPSAGLEVDFGNRGFLPPRMTTAERDNIANPALGLTIFNTDTDCLEFYNSAGWYNPCPRLAAAEAYAPSLLYGMNATLTAAVTDMGSCFVTERGVCWGTSPDPTLDDNVTAAGSNAGSYTALLSPLERNTAYHARAYAINCNGVSYSDNIQFTTTAGEVVQFTSVGSHSWNVPEGVAAAEVLVVGGGGGGGRYGGGGGAGGFIYSPLLSLPSESYSVTVGGGGAGWIGNAQAGGNGASGASSSFGSVTALGGGGGGNYGNTNSPGVNCSPGASGGSGGGGGCSNYTPPTPGCAGGSGTAGQGFAGSAGTGTSYRGGAGGGAAEAGAPATGSGKGGDGLISDISGTGAYYAGGGGGGGEGYGVNGTNLGGLGGGGRGARGNNSMTSAEIDGQPNTGGGGGGGADNLVEGVTRAGNGGSGIVIIRY
jgi:hypothetical protein